MSELETRYRGPSGVSRLIALVLVVSLVGSGIGFLGWAVLFHSSPVVTSQLTAFSVPSANLAVANITVTRESQFTEASCRLQAIAADHSVVGEVTHPVIDGPERQSVQVQIRTEREATSVALLGCTAPDQPQPR